MKPKKIKRFSSNIFFIGIYNAAIGLITLPASLIAGLLWDKVNPAAPFYFGAGTALVAPVVLLLFIVSYKKGLKIITG